MSFLEGKSKLVKETSTRLLSKKAMTVIISLESYVKKKEYISSI